MRSPIASLAWEIFCRNRRTLWVAVAIVGAAWFFNLSLANQFSANASEGNQLLTINCISMVASLLLLFSIFNYTEFDLQREWTGFPYRLFALPVTSLILVAVPMLLGVVSVELLYFTWVKLVFTHDQLARAEWLAVLIGGYMVFYQTILWTLAAFRFLRIIVLGLVGVSFVGIAFLPLFGEFVSSPWLSQKILSALICGLAVAAFGAAWVSIAHQRCGGGRQRSWLKYLIERIADALPRRQKNFASPSAAHFWYEWRRSGLLLPSSVAALLLLVIAPLTWLLRDDPRAAVWILLWTLAMPIILAAPLGKSFSKPDFWSSDLALSPFIAIRPLASGEMIVIKMKAAALSAAVTWLLVLAFLSIWLPLWANLAPLMMPRIGIWMSYSHSMWAEDVISVLFIIAAAFVTWKFLVGGLWVGLSGSRKMFLISLALYLLIPLLGFIGLTILLNHDQRVRAWATKDPDQVLAILEWIAALAVITKFWLAARSWRNITSARVRSYLLLWTSATLVLLALAILLWEHGLLALQLMSVLDILPVDVCRLRNLLVLLALLIIPLARLGFAPTSLTKNRHR